MAPVTAVLATGNPGKVVEIEALTEARLPGAIRWVGLRDLPPAPAPEEVGETFIDNAILKASAAATRSEWVALADDSGLVVDALGGAPGVYSARYAGAEATDEANVDKLLAELAPVPDEARTAHFHCAAALVMRAEAAPEGMLSGALPPGVQRHTSHEHLAPGLVAWTLEGQVQGVIARDRVGSGGFGYDPVFHHPDTGRRFAELSRDEKNQWSHRKRAVGPLTAWWMEQAFSAGPTPGRTR